MDTTRRAFVGSAAASCAAFMLNGPLALAAGSRPGPGTAGLVISALATDPSNCLQSNRNWSSFAETRFGQGLADRRVAFDALRDEIPDLELLTPKEIGERLAEMLLPGFYSVGADSTCVWTHHNYTDISYDQGAATNAPSSKGPAPYMAGQPRFDRNHLRAASVRGLLLQRGWKGFPYGSASDPHLLLTEGGTTRAVLDKEWGSGTPKRLSDSDYRVTQALLMARNIIRLSDDTAAGGAGIDMVTNYLQITVPTHDSGMFEVDLSARSLFTNVWKPMPGRL